MPRWNNPKCGFQKGFKHTDEWKEKMSKKMKGHRSFLPENFVPWNKGTKGICEPNSGSFKKGHKSPKAMLGKKHSEETKKKMSLFHKGKILSKETRIKMSESKKGEKSYLWKSGISPINKRIRKGLKYRLWREAIFKRDNYTCQKCKIRGGTLHPHHIKNFADYSNLRFVIDNGITLSEKAHREFHKKYGKKNNTEEQLKEFINILQV